MHEEWIAVAEQLVGSTTGQPSQVALRRAVSTAYYALFHTIERDAADLMAGSDQAGTPEWTKVYRLLDHTVAKQVCQRVGVRAPTTPIGKVATAFVLLQEKRHKADYDPNEPFDGIDVKTTVDETRDLIRGYVVVPEAQRRAFVLQLLFPDRKSRST